MRVLQFIPTLGYGGIASMILNYYRNMDRNKITFDFITHGGVEDFHSELIQNGSRIFYIETIRKIGFFHYFKKIIEIIKKEKYEIVHFHTGGIRLLFLPFFKHNGAKKIFVHAHSTKVDKYPKWFWKLWSTHFATQLIACGEEAGRKTFGKKDFIVIPNAINIENFFDIKESEVERIRQELNINKNTLTLGHVGAFIEQKNQLFICRIMEILKTEDIDFKMIFIGDGKQKSEIEKYVEDHNLKNYVIFTGKRNDVNQIMNVFDIFLLPSLYEGLPVVGIEAQVSGCYCIFSKNITREVDLNLGNIKFLDLNNENEWINEIINHLEYKRKIDINFTKRIKESEYNIKVSAAKLEKLYGV